MQPSSQHSRINLAELRALIVKKLGPERSKLYFYYLNKLVSLKLSKVEFNKLCSQLLGRENVPLHNKFICSIFKNACHAKVPPPLPAPPITRAKEVLKSLTDGYQQSVPYALSNGDILQASLQKAKPGISIGTNGKVDFASQQSTVTADNVVFENGDVNSCDIHKPLQHHQVLSEKAEDEGEVLLHYSAKLLQIKGSMNGLVSEDSKQQSGALVVEGGEQASTRSPLHAPLGIPFCSVSVGGARKVLPLEISGRCSSSHDCGGLLDTETLRKHMQQIAAAMGLEGVSMECANILNNGLDAYLKRLIRSSIELVGSRYGCDLTKNSAHKHHSYGKLVNGILPGHHFQVQNNSRPFEGMQEHGLHFPISLLDFKVAMELNPQQLGEDWPLLLEKICTRSYEE